MLKEKSKQGWRKKVGNMGEKEDTVKFHCVPKSVYIKHREFVHPLLLSQVHKQGTGGGTARI